MARTGTICMLVFLGIVSAATEPKWIEENTQETSFPSKSSPLPDLSLKCHHPPHHKRHPLHQKPNPNNPPHAALSPVDHAVPPSHIASPTQPPNTALSPVAVPPSHVASPIQPPPQTAPSLPSSQSPTQTPAHTAPSSPSPAVDNAVPSPHVAPISPPPSQSPVVNPPPSRPHPSPSCPPPPPPREDKSTDCSVVLINVDGCVSQLITFFFKPYKASISTQCCKVVSTISDDCFYSGFTHFKAPLLLSKVRNYCTHHQG